MKNHNNQSGNVLFYILIAVALIAGLSYAVTQGGRGSVGHLADQRNEMSASKVVEYFNTMESAVTQLRLRGCAETEISFENPISSNDYSNGNAPDDDSCHVFMPNGGGVHYRDYDMVITGDYGIAEVGTGAAELLVDMRVGQSSCMAINDFLGVNNSGVDGPPTDKLSTGDPFQGVYTTPSTVNQTIDHGDLRGRTTFCRVSTGTGSSAIYKFTRVLLAR